MIGLDTNIVVRYLVQDDAAQAASAVRLIHSLSSIEPGFISLVVVAELSWVLESCYGFARLELVDVLESLLTTKEVTVQAAELVSQAVRRFAVGQADFADYIIERSGYSAGCAGTFTLDQKAASAGMKLLR